MPDLTGNDAHSFSDPKNKDHDFSNPDNYLGSPKELLNSKNETITTNMKYCDICSIYCYILNFDAHLSGKKHQKNLIIKENLTGNIALY